MGRVGGLVVNGGSLSAYARHRKALGLRGGSLKAIQRFIDSGRAETCVSHDAAGQRVITDFALADAEWAANTDESKVPDHLKMTDDDTGASEDDNTFKGASAREKHFRAKLAELTYRKRAGELLERAPLQAALAETFTRCRTAILGVPNKFKQRLPDVPHEHVVVLDALLRETLESLIPPLTTPEGGSK